MRVCMCAYIYGIFVYRCLATTCTLLRIPLGPSYIYNVYALIKVVSLLQAIYCWDNRQCPDWRGVLFFRRSLIEILCVNYLSIALICTLTVFSFRRCLVFHLLGIISSLFINV